MSMKASEQVQPFIHLFKNSLGYCVYDVNTNQIIKVPQEVFTLLDENSMVNGEQDADARSYIEDLKSKGYLKTNRVKIPEHPLSEFLDDFFRNKLTHLTLQLTQMCNLKCEYCSYSGGYRNRQHSNRWMSFDTAKKAIDFFIKHSRDSVDIFGLSFYGGEPLLAFDMMKDCVRYAKERAEGRVIKFNFTTNGTLLTDEKIEFLLEHDFNILISLDGPDYIHDKHRKFAAGGQGSFSTLIGNIDNIRKNYPLFYKHNIGFNTVLDPSNKFTCINDFVIKSELFDEMTFSSTIISEAFAKNPLVYSDEFLQQYQYELFKVFLFKLGWLDSQAISAISINFFDSIRMMSKRLSAKSQIEISEKSHRGGPCLPGVQRLFVDIDGLLYPCERVSESSNVTVIGNIDSGIDLEKAKMLLNLEQATPDLCRNCWGYYYCNICVSRAEDGTKLSREMIEQQCESVKAGIENELQNCFMLEQLGYNNELDV